MFLFVFSLPLSTSQNAFQQTKFFLNNRTKLTPAKKKCTMFSWLLVCIVSLLVLMLFIGWWRCRIVLCVNCVAMKTVVYSDGNVPHMHVYRPCCCVTCVCVSERVFVCVFQLYLSQSHYAAVADVYFKSFVSLTKSDQKLQTSQIYQLTEPNMILSIRDAIFLPITSR